jgi:hypothetical protein
VRKCVIVVAIAAACATALLAGCAQNGEGFSPNQNAAAQIATSADTSLTEVTCAQVAPSPAWLPPQVTATAISCVGPSAGPPTRSPSREQAFANTPDQPVSPATGQTVRITQYTLAGAANASTIARDYSSGHPATTILLMTYVGVTSLSPALQDQYTNTTTMTLPSGVVARLTTMTNGYGPIRIEWTQGSNSYLLLSVHGITAEGVSGVPTDDLLKIAGSIATK